MGLTEPRRISIIVLVQGWYGQRIVLNIRSRIPDDWTIKVHELPRGLPILVEEPKELIPKQITKCELILSLGEHPAIASFLPNLIEITGAKAVIAPIDNSNWVPPGVRKQVYEELERKGVESSFPKPFCSMKTNSGNKFIDNFAKRFGKPDLRVTSKNGIIKKVDILRGSPCGATNFVAEKLVGNRKSKAPVDASLFVQTYPCLASRMNDPELGKSLIHVAAYITKASVQKSLSGEENAI